MARGTSNLFSFFFYGASFLPTIIFVLCLIGQDSVMSTDGVNGHISIFTAVFF